MLFSSLEFLFLFLPISLAIFFVVPLAFRNAVLLVVSLTFYGWGEPQYVFLMIATVILDYFFGLLVRGRRKKLWLAMAVFCNLAILGFFKYYDFLATLVGLPIPGLSLPVGISFYTFQALSYVVDVYRGERAQKSLVDFGTYITMFPQLVAGPIVRYGDIREELNQRTSSFPFAAEGILRFAAGLGKKVLLANPAGQAFESIVALSPTLGTLGAWGGMIFYAFQIYFDFSAYSDMAIGLGKILGFSFPENFNYPYCAVSIRDFWRRWHISLSTWFREYLYIPLGGNRRGRGRMLFNMLVVWALTGLWHGASVNFLLWGLYYFVLLVAERLFLGRWLERLPRPLCRVYALVGILFGWVLFAHTDFSVIGIFLGAMLGFGAPLAGPGEWYEISRNAVLLLVMVIGATPLPRRWFWRTVSDLKSSPLKKATLAVGTLALLVLCTAYLADASYNPFLYFRF